MTMKTPGKMKRTIGMTILIASFGGLFLGSLSSLYTQRVGERAKCLANAGAELVGLDQDGDKRLEVLNARSVCKIAQGVTAAAAHINFQIPEPEFVRQVRMSGVDFIANTQ